MLKNSNFNKYQMRLRYNAFRQKYMAIFGKYSKKISLSKSFVTNKFVKPKVILTPEQQKIREALKRSQRPSIINKFSNLYKKNNYRLFTSDSSKIKPMGNVKGFFAYLRFVVFNSKITHGLNNLIVLLLLISLSLFVVYLSFFDRYFVVKNYEITFGENSYLSQGKTEDLLYKLQTTKYLGILPENQFWFANSFALTTRASSIYPEITGMEILDRKWPNTLVVKITTEPVLLTLKVNNGEYWRINKNGEVASRDEVSLNENLVVLEIPISLTVDGKINKSVNLADYDFGKDPQIMEKFWFVVTTWNFFESLGVKVQNTYIHSLSNFDSNVTFVLDSGTSVYLDYTYSGKSNQFTRLTETLKNDTINEDLQKNKIKYIDFRISKKVFVCYIGGKC